MVLLSVILLSRWLHMHLHTLPCPLSWEQTQGQEPSRRQSPDTWVIILQSIRPMCKSSGMLSRSEILFSFSGTVDPATIIEGIDITMTEIPTA